LFQDILSIYTLILQSFLQLAAYERLENDVA